MWIETAEATAVDEIIFTVQPSGLIITVSPVTKEQYAATGRREKSDVMEMNEERKLSFKAAQHPWAQGLSLSQILMFGCCGDEAVGLGYRYIDNLLTGHFLIRSLLEADILCTQE